MANSLLSANSGRGGNSLESIPTTLNTDPLVVIVAFVPPDVSKFTSISANSLTILAKSFTGKVTVPSLSTFAFTAQRIPKSKFVVVR